MRYKLILAAQKYLTIVLLPPASTSTNKNPLTQYSLWPDPYLTVTTGCLGKSRTNQELTWLIYNMTSRKDVELLITVRWIDDTTPDPLAPAWERQRQILASSYGARRKLNVQVNVILSSKPIATESKHCGWPLHIHQEASQPGSSEPT